MSIITPSALTKSVQTMYETAYREAQDIARAYDQFANVTKQQKDDKGSSVTVTYHSDMEPKNSAGSRTADFTPQDIYEANVQVNTDFYKDGVWN